jgi:16S rRNA (uracil1498-N3)-methyltransferase
MSISRLYYDIPLRKDQCVELNSHASQYLLHVLRLKKNATLAVFNGTGGQFLAQLINIKKRASAVIKILAFQNGIPNPPLPIYLGQALAKAQRMDYALQKATELGVSAIMPLYSDRSNIQLSTTRLNNRMAHWMGVITHASAQSKRCDIPQLNLPETFSKTTLLDNDGLKLICTLTNQQSAIRHFTPPTKVTLLIGPEGGFTEAEVDLAKAKGFQCLSLGPRTLRTETATVTAISMIQMLWGDLR